MTDNGDYISKFNVASITGCWDIRKLNASLGLLVTILSTHNYVDDMSFRSIWSCKCAACIDQTETWDCTHLLPL